MNRDWLPFGTFSIAARDPSNGDLGVAVASKFFAVGSVVPWARAGVGAIATQSHANTSYGPAGLNLLAGGAPPELVLAELARSDPESRLRQVGIVDAQGRSATFTGDGCTGWAGGNARPNCAVQGNILVGAVVIDAMTAAFDAAQGELAERLLAALEAGDRVGGDSRGKQSAALLVVRAHGGYAGFNDRYIDIRSDDHPEPTADLKRLLSLRLGR